MSNMPSEAKKLHDEADAKEREAGDLRKKAYAVVKAEALTKPLLERLRFAAYARCDTCKAGLAYDPHGDPPAGSPLRMIDRWSCSAVLLGQIPAEEAKAHAEYPFTFYEIKSESQPSANGATTRPAAG